MTKVTDETEDGCLQIVVALALAVPCTLLNALVLSHYWRWFIAPLGVPMLTFAQFIGVNLTLSFMLYSVSATRKEQGAGALAVQNVVFMLLSWGIGALWHWGLS